jgi:transcriptional regulator with XRE-family HTH domain
MNNVSDDERKAIFAEEALVVDAQIFLHTLMEEKGISRADLARAMGVSRARITQMFSDECKNFTIRLFARAAFALGEKVELDCDHFQCARDQKVKGIARQSTNVALPAVWHGWTEEEPVTAPLSTSRLNSYISSLELKAA